MRKPNHVKGIDFTVWMLNGGPVPEEAQAKLEEAIEKTIFELFNDGYRLLTQTSKG
jgi:hypothetical protein